MLQHAICPATSRSTPLRLVQAGSVRLALPSTFADGLHHLLPRSICSLGELLARSVILDVAGETVYAVSSATGGDPGALLYAGRTDLAPWERMRRHAAKRRLGTEISLFDQMLALTPCCAEWAFTVAPPADYLPFVIATATRMRGRLDDLGLLPVRLDRRLETIMARSESWATARLIEWFVIAAAAPAFNRKGACYTARTFGVARPLDMLARFATILGEEERKAAPRAF